MLFETIRPEIDFNHAKYKAIVENRRIAGKAGGSSRSKKKQDAARENGAGGGAPPGNRNAAKKTFSQENMEEQTQPNQMLGLISIEKTTQAGSDIDSDTDSGSGGGVSSKQPPIQTTTILFINNCKSMGYSIDRQKAQEILSMGINSTWLSGIFTYPEFIAEEIQRNYPGKPLNEKRKLFIALLSKEDRKDEFPDWRKTCEAGAAAREERCRQQEADRERRRILDEARANPTACSHCGAAIAPDGERGVCPSCGYEYFFSEENGEWEFSKHVDLAAKFKDLINKKNSHCEVGATA